MRAQGEPIEFLVPSGKRAQVFHEKESLSTPKWLIQKLVEACEHSAVLGLLYLKNGSSNMITESTEDVSRWYVVQTKSKQEERVNSNLRAWGVETLNPKVRAAYLLHKR
jgi:hypothetical protein